MLGGFFALMAAATFAWTNAVVRRGVVTGSVTQAITLAIPPGRSRLSCSAAAHRQSRHSSSAFRPGLSRVRRCRHQPFLLGRYCNYRAINAIGNNLAGPVMQFNPHGVAVARGLLPRRKTDDLARHWHIADRRRADDGTPSWGCEGCSRKAGIARDIHAAFCGRLYFRVPRGAFLRGEPGACAVRGRRQGVGGKPCWRRVASISATA